MSLGPEWRAATKLCAIPLLIALVACGGRAADAPGATSTSTTAGSTTANSTTATSTPPHAAGSSPTPAVAEWCEPSPLAGTTSQATDAVASRPLDVNLDDISARVVEYPHPEHEGDPWSQWGQGIVAANGKFYSAIGDHLGTEGNSYIYEYDPGDQSLRMIGDVQSVVGHKPGETGYGKVHAQFVQGPCGELYFTTYWGRAREVSYGGGYRGDHLIRLDPATGEMTDMGVPVRRHGVPSLGSWPEGGLIYGEAADPEDYDSKGEFFVYDVRAGEVVFSEPVEPHVGFRDVLVDAGGRAYFSAGEGRLYVYDPRTGEVTDSPVMLPGSWLRASTVADSDGTVYGTTPERMFALGADGTVRDLGEVLRAVPSVALDPVKGRVFYVPDAHGRSWRAGAPVIAVDTTSGDRQELVRLNDAMEHQEDARVGGSYNIAMDVDAQRLFVGVNTGPPTEDSGFGSVFLVILDLG